MARYEKVTFVGGNARSTSGGDQGGFNYSAYVDTDYWTYENHTDGNKRLVCKKTFNARLILVQAANNSGYLQARRAVYQWFQDESVEDFLETSAGKQLLTVVTRKFNAGDIIRCWEEVVYNADSTVGMLIIMAVK